MYADAARMPAVTVHPSTVGPDGDGIDEPSIAILGVRHAGRAPISAGDVHLPLHFRFPGRQVVGAQVIDSRPQAVSDLIAECGGLARRQDSVALPRFPMNPADELRLAVVLSGTQTGIECSGHIRGTRIAETRTP